MGVKLTCTKCNTERSYKDFYACKRNKTGKMWHCKDCVREYQKIYKRNRTEKKKNQKLALKS